MQNRREATENLHERHRKAAAVMDIYTDERVPTAGEARHWYTEGWVDDGGLEELLEQAFDEYGQTGAPDWLGEGHHV